MQQTSLRLPRGKAGTENAHCSTPRVSGWFVAYYYGNGQQTHGVLQMSSKMRALLLFSPSSQHPRPSRPWGHRSRQRILWKVLKTADQPTTRQVVVQAMVPQPEERTASDSGGSLCRQRPRSCLRLCPAPCQWKAGLSTQGTQMTVVRAGCLSSTSDHHSTAVHSIKDVRQRSGMF